MCGDPGSVLRAEILTRSVKEGVRDGNIPCHPSRLSMPDHVLEWHILVAQLHYNLTPRSEKGAWDSETEQGDREKEERREAT